MYIVITSGRDTNLPLIYIANLPAIVQHNPNKWNAHNKDSAMRSLGPSTQGENSVSHVIFPALVCISSCASVKLVLPSKYCLFWESINRKSKVNNYLKCDLKISLFHHVGKCRPSKMAVQTVQGAKTKQYLAPNSLGLKQLA